jgi:predicted  nucleic acid-binding Zn-ribbon protein
MADNTFAMKLLKNRMKNLEKGIDLGIDDQIKDLEAKQNDLKIQIVADKVKLDDPAVKNNKKLEKIIQKRIDKAQDEFDKIEKKIKKLESENEKDVSKKDKLENVVEDIKLELNLTQE